jgi:hypothetical protein
MHDQGPDQAQASAARKPALSLSKGLTPSAKNSKPQQSSVPLSALCGESVEPWIPESKLSPLPESSINSFVRKILLTTPVFPRFYADVILALAPNSNDARILRPHYKEFFQR